MAVPNERESIFRLRAADGMASAEARMGAEAGISAEAVQKRHLCRSQKPFAHIKEIKMSIEKV